MKLEKLKTVTSVVLLVLSVVLAIGVNTFISPCKEQTESGMWMSCHWAGRAVFVLSLVLIIMSVLFFVFKENAEKRGVAAAMIPTSLAAAFLPQNAISLCMMETMRCHTLMRPGVMVFGILIAVFSVVGFICSKYSK